MVKTIQLMKCNTVTNYKGRVKMDPQTISNCIQGGQLLRAGGTTPLTPRQIQPCYVGVGLKPPRCQDQVAECVEAVPKEQS